VFLQGKVGEYKQGFGNGVHRNRCGIRQSKAHGEYEDEQLTTVQKRMFLIEFLPSRLVIVYQGNKNTGEPVFLQGKVGEKRPNFSQHYCCGFWNFQPTNVLPGFVIALSGVLMSPS